MKNKFRHNIKLSLVVLLAALFPALLVAQQDYEPSEERSSFQLRAQSDMDANRLRASYYNHGHNGKIDGGDPRQLDFEFPKNTGRVYMRFMSIHYGTQVKNQNDGNDLEIVNVAQFKNNRDGSQNWSLNPIEGYQRDNSGEIARSDRGPESPLGNTWPDSWPDKFEDGGDGWAGSWNGFFGRDQFNADLEFYYKTGDDRYTRFSGTGAFRPDSTDPSRGGLGIIMDTRILAWTQILISSTHFNIFEITNDSNFDYQRMAFGLWIADFVAARSTTNQPEFDIVRSVAYLTDTDRNNAPNAFDGLPIGQMGLSFLETPGNGADGIDNDGDSDTYDTSSNRYDPDNQNLYSSLTTNGGGFYSVASLDSVIPQFEAADFDERTINIGDKIVLIQEDGSRVIQEYDGNAFDYNGLTYGPGSITVREDLFPVSDPLFGVHIDGIDNDFDGLIDENQPNHLEKNTFDDSGNEFTIAVRFINYLYFDAGDTVQQGLIVPNQEIRARMASDAGFEDLVNNTYSGRFQNYFTSAPMIDEGRGDFFDNDRDWSENLDDVGIQGDPETPSVGQGDGLATSGAGTTFPGEPNIDKTDVSETDLIGVSRAQIFGAGELQVSLDSDIWFTYLIPGEFDIEGTPGSDQDIYVSSGLFPLRKGQTERFAVAISAAASSNAQGTFQDDRDELNRNLFQARQAYAADYQFATAPDPPILKAVPGDGKVTLYWDTNSEQSFDRYLNRITGNGNDFEGYKVYRSTDPSFEDIRNITDGFGNALYYTPIASFDIDNGVRGFDSVGVNGVRFNLGTDSGLQRFYEDNNVINGKTYYYAVTGYDAGFVPAGIAPSESPIQVSQGADGTVSFGVNVAQVRPYRSQAGYVSPETPQATIVQGSPGGSVSIDIIDPFELKADNLYEVTFEDTLIDGGTNPDTLRTLNFTLTNVTDGGNDTLLARSPNVNGGSNPITEGFTVSLTNVTTFGINQSRTGWNENENSSPHGFAISTGGVPKVSDYQIIIGENVGFGQSTERVIQDGSDSFTTPSIATNFKILNTYTGEEIEYAFDDINVDGSSVNPASCDPTINAPSNYESPPSGVLSAVGGLSGLCSDGIYFIEDVRDFQDTLSYKIELRPDVSGSNVLLTNNPIAGDTLEVFTTKPFSRNDKFQFRMDPENVPSVNSDSAANALDDILVIPNPYKVSSIYELEGSSNSTQQNRELHFTGMPVPSTLRIFTASGVLVKEIEVTDNNTQGENGGTYIWNMLTRDNLEISYGIYIYHVEAKGVGNKTGKFAVLK